MNSNLVLQLVLTQAWQILLLALIVGLLVRGPARNRPRTACLLWLVVVVKCVTPPVWNPDWSLFSQIHTVVSIPQQWVSQTPVDTGPTARPVGDTTDPASTVATEVFELRHHGGSPLQQSASADSETAGFRHKGSGSGNSNLWAQRVLAGLLIGVLAHLLLLTVRFACCLRRIRRQRVTDYDEPLNQLVCRLSVRLQLRRAPAVIVSDVRFGPAVLGLMRHVIVLPECLIQQLQARSDSDLPVTQTRDRSLNTELLTPILAHELLHIRRGDLLTGLLQAFARCLWWFHPAVWFANRLLSREIERCCDEQVVTELGCSPARYARSLLAVIEGRQLLKPVPVFPGMKPVEITSQRMERIMSLKTGTRRSRINLLNGLATAVFAAAVLPGVAPGQADDAARTLPQTEAAAVDAVGWRAIAEPADGHGPQTRATYALADLIQQLMTERGLSQQDAVEFLLHEVQAAAEQATDQQTDENLLQMKAVDSEAKLTCQAAYVLLDDQLTVVQSPAAQAAISDRLQRFRRFGFDLVKLQVRIISCPRKIAERLTAIADSEAETPVSVRVQPGSQTAAPGSPVEAVDYAVSPGQDTGPLRLQLFDSETSRQFLELAQNHPRTNLYQMTGTVWNGAIARFEDTVQRPFVVDIADKQPQVEIVREGLSLSVTPELDNSEAFRLQCRLQLSRIDQVRTVSQPSAFRQAGQSIQIPEVSSSTLQTTVECRTGRSLLISGLSWKDTQRASGIETDSLLVLVTPESVADDLAAMAVTEPPAADVASNPSAEVISDAGIVGAVAYQAQASDPAAEPQPDAPDPTDPELVTTVYRVADLVILHEEVWKANLPVSDSSTGSTASSQQSAIDFAPVVELIKTTVQPDSWRQDQETKIAVVEDNLSLVIRQTAEAHDQIADLLEQLRQLQNRQVASEIQVLHFETAKQLTWLQQHSSFHSSATSADWDLLTPDDARRFVSEAAQLGIQRGTHLKVMTFNGQAASLTANVSETQFLLQLTTAIQGDSKLIQLEAATSQKAGSNTRPSSATVNDGQTLLLDITETFTETNPMLQNLPHHERPFRNSAVPTGRVLLVVTPRILRLL